VILELLKEEHTIGELATPYKVTISRFIVLSVKIIPDTFFGIIHSSRLLLRWQSIAFVFDSFMSFL